MLEQVAIPSPGDLPDPGMEPGSPVLQADSLPPEPPRKHNIRRRVTGHITECSLHAKDYCSASHVASHLMFTGRNLLTLVLHTRKPRHREVK